MKPQALALLAAAAFVGGCDPCRSLRLWQGGEHDSPLSTVQSLRYNVCEKNWAAAAAAIAPGSDYDRERPGNHAARDYWFVPSPILGVGELPFPLGPEDAIIAQRINGVRAEVELRHIQHYDKGGRPRALLLQQFGTEWLIVGYNNW
jgi:hypothetical protein